MDVLNGLQIQIDMFYYNLVLSFAGLHWSLLRGLVMMGYTVRLINDWLIENAFVPLIAQTNASLSLAVSFAFVLALLVLGITYMLAALIKLDVVNFRSALTWYIAGVLFFTIGPSLYSGMNDFRMSIAQGFYASTLQGLQDNMGSTFGSLDQVETTDLGLGPICDYLDVYLPGATGPGTIDGLDVALAYLRADGPDVMGYPQPVFSPGCPAHLLNPLTGEAISQVPQEWFMDDSYFDAANSPMNFADMDAEARAASIAMASSAHGRLLTAWPLIIFGVVEQMAYLLITIAMGITFLSFSLAILFAFFKKTEVIAKSIIDQWIELIVQTVVIAMVQSLVVAFFLAGTTAGNGMVVLGIGLICLIFMLIVLWSGIKAVWNSLNRLFNAMGQASGGVMLSPVAAANIAGGATAKAAGAAVSVGSNTLAGMNALGQGATMSQAAGVAFGGSRTLSGAARTLAYLPGVRSTSLGEAAEQFTEGSITRQVARNVPGVGRIAGPVVGSMLLTDRDPAKAEYDEQGRAVNRPMLVPAVGRGLDKWTVPHGATGRARTAADDYLETPDGEMVPLGSFTPARQPRMGTFTPVSTERSQPLATTDTEDNYHEERRQQRSDYGAEMQGEEMEQHLSDVMRSNTGVASPLGEMLDNKQDTRSGEDQRLGQVASQLARSADMLGRAAQMMVGQLRVSGVPDVAGVMGDVVGQVQAERQASGEAPTAGLNHLQVGERMAQVMGVTPQGDGGSPIRRDLARFGLFLNQAMKTGLSSQQTEQVVREVQSSPEKKMDAATRDDLTRQVQANQGVSWVQARGEVDRLEHGAGMLPTEVTAFGKVEVPRPEVQVNPTIQVDVKGDDPA